MAKTAKAAWRRGQRGTTRRRTAGDALLQTSIAAYRDAFVRHLLERSPGFVVWAGEDYFDPNIRLSTYGRLHTQRLRNQFVLGRRFEWQHGAFAAARSPRTVVLEMNPKILSNWPILLYRRAVARRTVVWGHAWPRSGPESKTFFARVPMMRLANAVLVYTERDREQLAMRVSTPIFVAPNAVVSVSEWPSNDGGNPLNVAVVGRLATAKKPALALEAWLSICDRLDPSARLIFVGDGPLRQALETAAAHHRYASRVVFMGEVTDRKGLSEVYANALISISAGYAGLSLTDSLGYGVPMAIADHEPHAPEIALASQANSRFFKADDASSLAMTILQFFADREFWISQRAAIAAEVRDAYSIEAMVNGFLGAVRGV